MPRHRLIVEFQNEFGEHFGPSRAERFFSRLFSHAVLGGDAPDVEVTVLPQENAIERVLNVPRLRRLEIHLRRPNPDDLAEEAQKILKELQDQGAKSQDLIWTKAAGVPTLTPNEGTKTLAKVAAENGYAASVGADAHENRIEESTKAHPKRVSAALEPDQSALAKFLTSVRFF